MKYCSHCGNVLLDEAVLCPSCGCAVAATYKTTNEQLLSQLANRTKINGIIWTVIGAVQILMGTFFNWWILIVGVLNIITGVKDINNSDKIPGNPCGIVQDHEPVTGAVITLVYNLLIGGLIGVIGSIYYFVAIRGLVMENKAQFLAMEEAYNQAQGTM